MEFKMSAEEIAARVFYLKEQGQYERAGDIFRALNMLAESLHPSDASKLYEFVIKMDSFLSDMEKF